MKPTISEKNTVAPSYASGGTISPALNILAHDLIDTTTNNEVYEHEGEDEDMKNMKMKENMNMKKNMKKKMKTMENMKKNMKMKTNMKKKKKKKKKKIKK